MRRASRGAGGAREHDAHHVTVLVVLDQRAVEDELGRGFRRVPRVHEGVRPGRPRSVEGLEPAQRVAQLVLEREEVVLGRLDAHQQAVEGGDVDPGRIAPALERLDERRAGAGERVEHVPRARQVPLEQRLDELRDELPEVRVQPVDVLRPLALGQVALRPGEVEVELAVERVLRRSHRPDAVRRRRALERLSSERSRPPDAPSLGGDVEAHVAARLLRVRGEPGLGGLPQPAHLLRRDHLERIAAAPRRPSPSPRRRRSCGRGAAPGRARSRRSRRSSPARGSRAAGSATARAARRASRSHAC